MPEIIGVTFPIPKSYVSRFFDHGKSVFIKPAITFKKIIPGLKFIFYQSQEDTGYVGDAIIKKITLAEDPFSFFNTYHNDVFLTREELENYIEQIDKWKEIRSSSAPKKKRSPKRKKWVAIELESIRKYNVPRKTKFVPVGGKYLYSDLE